MTVGRRLKREISWQPSAAAHRFDGNLNRRENHCHRIPYGPPLLEIKESGTQITIKEKVKLSIYEKYEKFRGFSKVIL